MKRLIYYPGFESINENWLKFALLYVDKLSPIVPLRMQKKYSELYNLLVGESDLIVQEPPPYREGYKSSLDTIEIINQIDIAPHSYDLFFKDVNVIRSWKNKANHQYTLYEEKFSLDWTHFCLDNGFGSLDDNGIRLPESLAILYMTVLANRMADDKNISPITDHIQWDDLSYFLKRAAPVVTNETVNAKGIISLTLPANLNAIPIKDIIRLRNSDGFKQNQEAFHNELQDFLSKLENGDHSLEFVEKYSKASSSFNEQILSIGNDTTVVGLGTWMLLSKVAPGLGEILKLAGAATGVIIKQGFSISKAWKSSGPPRKCRRYLASLEMMPVR